MRPIGKNIIITSVDEEIKTDSGILLSADDVGEMRYKKGLVIKVGSDVDVIKEGQMINYDKRAGHTMLISDKPYTIIQEKDVVVVL